MVSYLLFSYLTHARLSPPSQLFSKHLSLNLAQMAPGTVPRAANRSKSKLYITQIIAFLKRMIIKHTRKKTAFQNRLLNRLLFSFIRRGQG